ncbi:MAG: M23 family metallopeptidase [Spirochaetales bacterium]|nr:M23 family metallopeptidase [Spirochaetales bacterium]
MGFLQLTRLSVRVVSLSLALIILCIPLAAFPRIHSTTLQDPVFRQLKEDIDRYHQSVQRNEPVPMLSIFELTVPVEMDILSVAARCNLPYEAIATLNGYASNVFFKGGEILLVPNMPAVFARTDKPTDLDMLIVASRASENRMEIRINSRKIIAFTGTRFHPVERAMFLGVFFRYPVLAGYISSDFGRRHDPFTGHPAFHNGIDLAAPVGTPVIAAREGTVTRIAQNEVLGNYIIIDHKSGYETLYGHLSKALVRLNQEVHSGMIIGEIGVTGMTTGPHLHFEVRQHGNPQNPKLLLPKGQE